MAHIYEHNEFGKTSISVVFDAGSQFESEGQYGTMHLMEHLICKNYEDMQDLFIKHGITWNAYTSTEQVVFWLTGLEEYLTPAIKQKFVKKVIGGLKVKNNRFKTEKKVVINEYKDCFNDPSSGGTLNLYRTKFGDFNAIGKLEDIQNFTLEDAKNIYSKFFTKPARIVEVGPNKTDLSFVEYEEKPVNPFKVIKYKKNYNLPLEGIPENTKSEVTYLSKKLVNKKDYEYLEFAIAMLNGGLSSPWYKKIRVENGLTYHSSMSLDCFRDRAIFQFGAVTEKETEKDIIAIYEELIANLDNDLTQERFDLVSALCDVEEKEKQLLRYTNDDDLVRDGLIQSPDNIDNITLEKVKEVAKKYINKENLELNIF